MLQQIYKRNKTGPQASSRLANPVQQHLKLISISRQRPLAVAVTSVFGFGSFPYKLSMLWYLTTGKRIHSKLLGLESCP